MSGAVPEGITRVAADLVGDLRWRPLRGDFLVTNDLGDWLFLAGEEMRAFFHGEVRPGDPLYERLRAKRFVHGELELGEAVRRYKARKAFLDHGPRRHVLVVTERDRGDAPGDGDDMPVETAERAIDCAFMSTSPDIDLHLEGGEPLLAFDVVRHAIRYAGDKNRLARKRLNVTIETDLESVSDDELSFLVERDVRLDVRATDALLDDDASPAAREVRRYHAALGAAGKSFRGSLVLDVEARHLPRLAAVVDRARDLGFAAVDLRSRPSRPAHGEEPGYTAGEFVRAYEGALDRLVALGRTGSDLHERQAALFLARILDRGPGRDVRYRSPAADGLGELSYHVDGRVFTSGEGRRLADRGDDLFQVGELRYHGYHDMVASPTVRAVVLASILDGQPGWTDHAYKPFSGLSPARAYGEHGSIHGRMGESGTAQIVVGLLDLLFLRLHGGDPEVRAVFDRWAEAAA